MFNNLYGNEINTNTSLNFMESELIRFLPFILIFIIFYFLLIRPQQKKIKAHQVMLSSLRKGDKVITSGGIIGSIVKIINDQEVLLEISNNVVVRLVRSTITDVITKSVPLAINEVEEKIDQNIINNKNKK